MHLPIIIPVGINPSDTIIEKIAVFLELVKPHEVVKGGKLLMFYDERSKAHYLNCHLKGTALQAYCDFNASIDVGDDDDIIYKLNRDVTEDESAYKQMADDALNGRTFEDMVVEFDTSYAEEKPLKIYGGQHRIKAISEAANKKGEIVHGVRIYFDLTREQKVEIATVNNTSIVVPSDLIDRMREQLLGSELRDWCQKVGLLNKDKDFADRRNPDTPTVRIARTLLVNYFKGVHAKEDDFHQPVVCKSGGIEDEYMEMRTKMDWDDERLYEMGSQFARLHKKQRDIVTGRDKDNIAEFARKALSLAVVASWPYAAGLFQRDETRLQNHYALTDSATEVSDPLNAKELSRARLPGTDPDTYRGLGNRISAGELGRMLEVFFIQATKNPPRGITLKLANAAIRSFEAKRAKRDADLALRKI